MLVKVNFCYQCGRPVGAQAVKCIYCSAPTRRIIRPDRRCPYCDEPIRHKAIKCVHCGEFLDGRPREEKPLNAKAAQPTFIIEKAIISPQGLAVPPPPSHMLGSGGGQARGFLEQGGQPQRPVQALPAPMSPEDEDNPLPNVGEQMAGGFTRVDDDSVMDVEAHPAGGNLPAVASREVAPMGGNLPAARGGLPAAHHASGLPVTTVAPLPPALQAILEFLKRLFLRRNQPDDTINISTRSEEDNYRTCMMCQTEILSADNYCYHCGQQYAVKPAGWATTPRRTEPEKSNAPLFVLIVASLCGYAFGESMIASYRPEAVKPLLVAFAAAAPMLSFFAFIRKQGFVSRMIAVAFLLVSLGTIVYFLPDAFRGGP